MNIERPKSRQNMPENAKLVFHGQIFDAYQWEVEGYDGRTMIFEKLVRPDTVTVIAITKDGKVLLANEQQPGKEPYLTCVGGRVDKGEDPFAAVQRELLEETGYKSDKWELFHSVQPVSKIDWAIYIFIAKDCEKVAEQSLDGGEKIELQFMTVDEFFNLVLSSDFDYWELKMIFMQAKLDGKIEELKQKFLN